MPRDREIVKEKRDAVREVFYKHLKEMGRICRIDFIYQLTAESEAPSFYISFREARYIIHASETGRLRGRLKSLTNQRDIDFAEAYKRFASKHEGHLKSWMINETINTPAKSFYMKGTEVARIISIRANKTQPTVKKEMYSLVEQD